MSNQLQANGDHWCARLMLTYINAVYCLPVLPSQQENLIDGTPLSSVDSIACPIYNTIYQYDGYQSLDHKGVRPSNSSTLLFEIQLLNRQIWYNSTNTETVCHRLRMAGQNGYLDMHVSSLLMQNTAQVIPACRMLGYNIVYTVLCIPLNSTCRHNYAYNYFEFVYIHTAAYTYIIYVASSTVTTM